MIWNKQNLIWRLEDMVGRPSDLQSKSSSTYLYLSVFLFGLFIFISLAIIRSIQMGRIPIFLYNDVAWIPYQGSNISVETFGFSAGMTMTNNTIPAAITRACTLSESEYGRKIELLADARYHYTYQGLINQINMFLRDPFGPRGGNLRCIDHPKTERCCDAPRVEFKNFSLIRHHADKQVYVVEDGLKRPIHSIEVFTKYGFDFSDVQILHSKVDLDKLSTGPELM